mgnify:FL=1
MSSFRLAVPAAVLANYTRQGLGRNSRYECHVQMCHTNRYYGISRSSLQVFYRLFVLYNSILDQEQIRECSDISNTIRNIPGTALG